MWRAGAWARQAAAVIGAADRALRGRLEAALVIGGHDVLASTDSAEQAIEAAGSGSAELLVLACLLEPFRPLREIHAARAVVGELPIVVVATGSLAGAAPKLISAGADGLVWEYELEQTLVPTIRTVLAHQLCVPASLRDALVRPVFSHREKQVLELVLAGLTNSEIAGRLYLSESTVKSHLASTFRKLGVNSRRDAATRAMDPGIGLDFTTRPNFATTAGS